MLNEKNMARIDLLRQRPLKTEILYEEFHYKFYLRFSQNEELGTFEERYADAYRYAYSNLTLSIDDGELIVGKPENVLSAEERKQWETFKTGIAEEVGYHNCGQDTHMTFDYEKVLSQGLNGMIALIDEKMSGLTADDAETNKKKRFYWLCREILGTVVDYSNRYAAYAMELAKKTENTERKAELIEIARICAKVPANPAESFYEAVQSAHFITHAVSVDPLRWHSHQQYQMGHPDRYLYPYYQKDLESGKLTKEDAQLLLDCLAVQINNRLPNGLSSGYMVGGRDRNGNLVANDLTEMGMSVIEDVRLVFPAVGFCYTPDMPESYLEKACSVLAKGHSHPAIFNDDLIVNGLIQYGIPEEEARDYIHSSCVEITPERSSNVWVASPYHNLLRPLLDSMKEDGVTRNFTTMDELVAAVFEKLDAGVLKGFEEMNACRQSRAEDRINPLLSCLVNDCLERGMDIEQGGGRYNWIMPSFVGMANLADSLNVVDQLVFKEKKYTIPQICGMLDCNFEGYETQRLEMLNRVAKYGNDNEEADCWCNLITEHIVEECKKYTPVFTNGKLVPSVFCWVMHEKFGSETEASPDGRKAGFPLGDGSGPAQGREMNGPTASILSSTKWNHQDFIGGVAVNMKFSKKVFNDDSYQKMKALIKTFMMRGGFEIQINVLDRDTLLAAQENPEAYQDLVVRIGGYSDYFVKISPNMQAEVLLRTEHEM